MSRTETWNQLSPEEIGEHYDNLFKLIFPGQKYVRVPTHVIVGYLDGKMIGMIDGYPRDAGQFFIHYAGFVPGTKFKDVWKAWHRMMDDLKSQGISVISTQVKNDNSASLRMLLKLGYKIHGTHVAYSAIYVDLYKEL
jgi:RimJ/RimL family protein N-acetyltransferase